MTNDTLKAILDRRSIRAYTPETLTRDEIDTLVEVALASPSANDHQPWHFCFLLDRDRIRTISDAAMDTFRQSGSQGMVDWLESLGGNIFYRAPLVVVLSSPKDKPSALDAGIAMENLVIAAQSMGLGSCYIGLARGAFGGARADEMARLAGIPETHAYEIALCIGHAAATKEAHAMHPEKVTILE